MNFAYPWILYLLWLVPAAAAWWIMIRKKQEAAMSALVSREMQAKLCPAGGSARFLLQLVLILIGTTAIIFASARPQWGKKETVVTQKGRDLIIALDVSRSMLANDVRPNRLERAKTDIIDLIKELKGDRAGLITFRHKAAVLCPLTSDYSFIRQVLDSASIESAPRGETDLGDAISKAIDAFDSTDPSHKAIIMISDGEDLSGRAMEMAKKAASLKIPIFTVGLGSRAGSTIPEPSNKSSKMQYKGENVTTKLDHDTLYAIAKTTGGAYVPIETAGMTSITLGTLYKNHLRNIQARETEESLSLNFIDRYQYFLLPGALLLIAAGYLSRGRLGGKARKSDRPANKRSSAPPPLPSQRLAMLVIALSLPAALPHADAAEPADGSNTVQQAVQQPAETGPELIETPEGREGAREAQSLYWLGKYSESAKAYEKAANNLAGRTRDNCLYNAGVAYYKAGLFKQSADVLASLSSSSFIDRNKLNMALGTALYRGSSANSTNDADTLTEKANMLRNAGESYKIASRSDAKGRPAEKNLAVVLNALPSADLEAKTARLLKKYEKTGASGIAADLLKQQRAFTNSIPAVLTNSMPTSIIQYEELAAKQLGISDLILPLKEKIREGLAQAKMTDTNSVQDTEMYMKLLDATGDMLKESYSRLRDTDPAGYDAAASAESGIYQCWKPIADCHALLTEDILRQTNVITGALLAGSSAQKQEHIKADQNECAKLTELFKIRFEEAYPDKGDSNSVPAKVNMQGQDSQEQLKPEDRQKIIQYTDQTIALQRKAAINLATNAPSTIIPHARKSHDLLKEIEKLLPKQKNQQDQQQEQNQQNESRDQQQNQEKQQEPQDQKQDNKENEQKKDEKEKLPEDIQKMIDKALEREKDHEKEKQNRQNVPLMPVGRDW